MNLEQARRFALSLPEANEEPHFEFSSFRIRGKIFATVPPDRRHLHIFVDEHEAKALAAEEPKTFEELWWGKKLVGVRVTLAKADAVVVRELLEDSWRKRAPKRLIAQWEASEPP